MVRLKTFFLNLLFLPFFVALPHSLLTAENGLTAENNNSALTFSHAEYDALLKKIVHVTGSKSLVNYTILKQERTILDAYIQKIATVSAENFKTWHPHAQLAFLINAYNALTLQLVIDHYPVSSIKDTGTESQSAWSKEFFTLFEKNRSLDFLEHEFIRKRYNESRIHFALVCAAISCPPLRAEAYTGELLLTQLEDQKEKFLLDADRNYVNVEEKKIYLSKLFSWFKSDFENAIPGQRRPIYEYIEPYLSKSFTLYPTFKIAYLPYDWKLNDYQPDSDSQ
jgi:hypothetical protein